MYWDSCSLVSNEMDSGLEDIDPHMDENLFEGDIILPKGVSPRTARRQPVKLWPNNLVPFTISSGFSPTELEKIFEAIEDFHLFTCVKFVPIVPMQNMLRDYIVFVKTKKNKCSSKLGKRGGAQKIKLGSNCETGNIKHEIMHAIGIE